MREARKQDATRALTAALARLLVPVVRILLRFGVTYGVFANVAKHIFVRVAARDFRIAGRKQSASRVSVVTGLPRKEVARILAAPADEIAISGEEHSRVARLISGWRHDKDFRDARGRPAVLHVEGRRRSFSELVKRYGADVPTRAALDELVRLQAVDTLKDGRIRLVAESYVPVDLDVDKFGILGADVADLVSTIDHNLVSDPSNAFFQRKVTYDNVPSDAAGKLRRRAHADAERLINKTDKAFARSDRDLNSSITGPGRKRVVLGVWYHEEDFPGEMEREHDEDDANEE